MAVYLLHSSVPLKRSNGSPVLHYIGYAPDGQVHRRLDDHLHNKSSSTLVREFLRQGADLLVGNVWTGETYQDEQRRKRMGHLQRYCYVCRLNALREEWYQRVGQPGPIFPGGSER